MAKVIFTPWKTQAQLLSVRDEFYPAPAYHGPDMRSHACAIVEAWKLRGNVPHHVEATALLTDAILHDDAQSNSIFSIRATYSAAFCRFVTGLVDSKIPGVRRTMFQRAMDLGLPASFVELRHEATHREPPSLVVLRKATQRSLEWLWDNYWAGIDDIEAISRPEHGNDSSLKAVLSEILREFSAGSGSQQVAKKRKRDQEVSAAAHIVSICSSSSEAVRVLPSILLEDSLLVPPKRKLGESMSESFDKWDAVLKRITEGFPSFLMYLAEVLIHGLVFNPKMSSPQNASAEAVFLWLSHLLASESWESHQALCPRSYILSACDESPNHWAKLLGEQLRKQGHKKAKTVSNPKTVNLPSSKKNGVNTPNAPSSTTQMLAEYGWETAEKWDRTGKGNNYAYLVTDEPTKKSVIIDPANPPEVAPVLKSQISEGKIDLTAIINTHHHWDHAGGNDEILKQFSGLQVIGGANCQSVTKTPAHESTFKIGERILVKALHTRAIRRTASAILCKMGINELYLLETLCSLAVGLLNPTIERFMALIISTGCGRFFEGNAAEMHNALNKVLAALPDDTKVYPGHEYTKQNVKFCISVSESEPIKKLQAFAEANKETQGKFTIGDEKLHNVFMRVQDPEIQQKVGKTDPVDVMTALREMKNAM
ncbi:Hydroxyacylglutathione hydrolase [Penicillium chermesinum]|nr:Hydroxyacylglutathione hydrolase [Penicillium chermesinum]